MLISVLQPGARLHYGVPQILARHGLLRALHTDAHGDHAGLRLLDMFWPGRAQPPPLQRLLGRRLPEEIAATLVRDRPMLAIACDLAQRLGVARPSPADLLHRLLDDVEHSAIATGDILYTVLVNEDLETLKRLKARGIKIVHECIIGPDVGRLLAHEHTRFPGLEPIEDRSRMETGLARDREKYALCDLILVPSTFTRSAVAELAPREPRIEVVPYGMDLAPFSGPAVPIPGRILSVGTVGLRKGSPDLAAAARHLAHARDLTVRVVGPVAEHLRQHPLMRGPTYVGQVPRARVKAEFAQADVLAFPTICDSFGLVVIEALAMGVPVVATPNCGDIVRDGIDGFIVPAGDPIALAGALDRIVRDRSLRTRMSNAARERAQGFSLDAYAARLLPVLRSV